MPTIFDRMASDDSTSRRKRIIVILISVAIALSVAVISLEISTKSKDVIDNDAFGISDDESTEKVPPVASSTLRGEGTYSKNSISPQILGEEDVVETGINLIKNTESNDTAMAARSLVDNASDIMLINQDVLKRQSSSVRDCPPGQALWHILLVTDDYPWETRWSLYSKSREDGRNVLLASGPPEKRNYSRRTRYTGNLCLQAGQYFIKWYDQMGDGLCCKYGPGEWSVSIDGEVALRSDPMDSSFSERDFPFEVTTSASGEKITGKFLLMGLTINVELDDGTFYELRNLPGDFDYADNGLVTGKSFITLPIGTVFSRDGMADVFGEAPKTLNYNERQRNRELANPFKGYKSILAVRIIAADGETTIDETLLSNSIYGNDVDPVTLVSQIKACSHGKLNLIKASDRVGRSDVSGDVKISNGVVTVHLPLVSINEGHATMRNAVTRELNHIFDVTHPNELADYLFYCLPPGTTIYSRLGGSGIAYAYFNSWLSVFNDKWSTSVSLQMHELGHSLNMGHSNEGGVEYEDQTGIMGASYPNSNVPRACFNAAKSWQTGWYRDKSITINSSGANKCFDGVIHGIADYAVATTVLLKVQNGQGNDYFVNFNAKKGINRGTQEAGNQVTVVRRPRGPRDSYAESELVAKLDSGMYYNFFGYNVSVGKIDNEAGTAEVRVLPSGRNECI